METPNPPDETPPRASNEPAGSPDGGGLPPNELPAASVAASVPTTSGSGLPANVAAGLAELVPLIGGVIFYSLDKQNALVRFHSMQSIYFGAAWIILSIVFMILSAIPFIGFLFLIFWSLVGLGAFVLWLLAVVNAFNGKVWEMPILGKMVRDQLAGSAV